jgi:hypothetical protein
MPIWHRRLINFTAHILPMNDRICSCAGRQKNDLAITPLADRKLLSGDDLRRSGVGVVRVLEGLKPETRTAAADPQRPRAHASRNHAGGLLS